MLPRLVGMSGAPGVHSPGRAHLLHIVRRGFLRCRQQAHIQRLEIRPHGGILRDNILAIPFLDHDQRVGVDRRHLRIEPPGIQAFLAEGEHGFVAAAPSWQQRVEHCGIQGHVVELGGHSPIKPIAHRALSLPRRIHDVDHELAALGVLGM